MEKWKINTDQYTQWEINFKVLNNDTASSYIAQDKDIYKAIEELKNKRNDIEMLLSIRDVARTGSDYEFNKLNVLDMDKVKRILKGSNETPRSSYRFDADTLEKLNEIAEHYFGTSEKMQTAALKMLIGKEHKSIYGGATNMSKIEITLNKIWEMAKETKNFKTAEIEVVVPETKEHYELKYKYWLEIKEHTPVYKRQIIDHKTPGGGNMAGEEFELLIPENASEIGKSFYYNNGEKAVNVNKEHITELAKIVY